MPKEKAEHLRRLLAAAQASLDLGLARAAGCEDYSDFKAELLKSLHRDSGFDAAARAFHEQTEIRAGAAGPRRGPPRAARGAAAVGGARASRMEPSHGPKDRRRGWRLSKGRRRGQSRRKD